MFMVYWQLSDPYILADEAAAGLVRDRQRRHRQEHGSRRDCDCAIAPASDDACRSRSPVVGGRVARRDPVRFGTAARVTDSLEVSRLRRASEFEAFIGRIVPIRAISRRMLRSRTFGYVTAALPGLEAFLLLERLRIMAGDAALKDLYLVIDAPASGSAVELLSVSWG